jgi:AraC-like DNA-binding protein
VPRQVGKADRVMYRTADISDAGTWTTAETLDDFAALCCHQPHVTLLSDPNSFSLTQRVGGIGPVTLGEFVVGSDVSMDCGELCSGYRVNVLRSGRIESVHRGSSLRVRHGSVAVYQPQGHAAARWAAGTRMLALKIDRGAVDDALSDALGWQVTSQIDFAPVMPTTTPAARSWINMLVLLYEHISRPDSLLTQPLVGLPFVDSLIRGFLLAADHPHRDAVGADAEQAPPRAVRTAIDVIESEAHLPTTVSSLAARSHVSVRSLQQGFGSYLGVSPMEYLREVRLRRAHQTLRESDPSEVTVASVAYRWGFTNLGRFAAAHADRYGEAPSVTLHRTAFPRNAQRAMRPR